MFEYLTVRWTLRVWDQASRCGGLTLVSQSARLSIPEHPEARMLSFGVILTFYPFEDRIR